MRVGIFTECYKPVMNGVVVSIETFKKALEEKGHEIFIFCPDHPEAKVEHGVYRFPSIRDKKGRLYPIAVPFLDIEKSYLPKDIIESLDIVHTQHMFTMGRMARYVARRYNKPLVHTYHTLIAEYTHYAGIFGSLTKLYLINMSRRFCNSCDEIVTPSDSMKKILSGYRIKTDIVPIPTGIEPSNYRRYGSAEFRKEHGINKQDKLLLYLSRIAKEKNIDFLFKSFVSIQKKYPDCHLIMAGGGPEEEWCHQRVEKLGIKNKVTFTGMLPKEQANHLFGMADIFVFPSVTETQGIVIAEAMASGTPPVAVNKMGPTDLIRDGKDGYLTKLNTSDFSSKVVELLLDDKLREKFARNGLLRVDEFSIDASVSKLIELYNKLVANSKE